MAVPHTVGAKYNSKLTTTEIAAAVRGEIKAAQKKGTIDPGYKVSVTKQSFSGGSSITITLKALPASVQLTTLAYLKQCEAKGFIEYYDRLPKYTPEVKATLDQLKQMLSAYNFDDSNSSIDYFHVNFYKHIEVCWELERDIHKAMRAAAITAAPVAAQVAL